MINIYNDHILICFYFWMIYDKVMYPIINTNTVFHEFRYINMILINVYTYLDIELYINTLIFRHICLIEIYYI